MSQQKQKKARTEAEVAVEEDDDDSEEEEVDTYVVVTETYPTTYGANQGTTYDRGRMIALTRVDVTQDFNTREEALEHGKQLRDASEFFTDYCCTTTNNNHTSGEEEDTVGDRDNHPPWDSAEMKNFDNDEEVRISIMTTMDYDDWAYETQLYLENKQREHRRQQKIEERL